jgi:lipopolysaccharide transport system permease protein
MLWSPDRSEEGLYVRAVRTFHLVRVLTPRELRIRYRQSVLNALWAVISPIAILVIYGVVLAQSFGVEGVCGSTYLETAWAGLVVWTFVASAIGAAAGSLVASADLITKLYFPREALPLAAVGAAMVELSVGVVSLILLVVVQGTGLGLVAVSAVLPILMIVIWTAAVSIMLAALAAFTRDILHGVNLALRVGFFASTVMYAAVDLPHALAWSENVNPVTVATTAVRDALLCGTSPNFGVLAAHLVIAGAMLVGAVLYMRSVESRIVDVI